MIQIFIFTLLLFLGTPNEGFAAPFRVVLDPGHGGSDWGAIYKEKNRSFTEKELTLLLAKEVARELKRRKIETLLTREKDIDLELSDRTEFANQKKADVFLSLHLNSSPGKRDFQPKGYETYIFNNSTSETSQRIAALENSHSLLKGSKAKVAEKKEVSLIMKDLILTANTSESKRLACLVQKDLVRARKAEAEDFDRGVKQGLFFVLMGADMPSVLVEAGFLDHFGDRSQILVPGSRKRLARAIARGIGRFRDGRGTPMALRTLSDCQVR